MMLKRGRLFLSQVCTAVQVCQAINYHCMCPAPPCLVNSGQQVLALKKQLSGFHDPDTGKLTCAVGSSMPEACGGLVGTIS